MIDKREYILLNAFHVVVDGLRDSIPIVLAFIVVAFGADEKAMGLIVSLTIAAGTLAGLSTLYLSGSLGFARTQCLIMLCSGLGFFLSAFSPTLIAAALCFIVAAIGHGVFHNMAFSHITLHTERKKLGKVMSDFTAIGDIGRIPLVSLAGFGAALSVFAVPGWRVVCGVYGLAALLFALYLVLDNSRKTQPQASEPETQEKVAPGPSRSNFPQFTLLRDRDLFFSILASALNALGGGMIFVFLPMLLFAKGLDPKSIGTFALGFTVGSMLGKMACGRMVDMFGTRVVFVVSELLLACLLLVLLAASHPGFIVFVALCTGIVTNGTVPVVQTIITEPVKQTQHYNDIFAINSFVCGCINIATPLVFGFVASVFNIELVYVLMAALVVCAVIPVALLSPRRS